MIILLLLLMGTLGTAGNSQAYSNVSFSFSFHDALAPYGTWVNVSSYGNVFRPNAYSGWRPYTQGHWIYTDYGPMWDTAEPYGWATYHYGRWIFTASYGWVWVPGYEYYPSRVTWAYGDDYLGWSPIYPNPGFSNTNVWFFIDRDHYGYDNYSRYYLRGDRVRPLFDRRVVRVRDSRWDRRDFERVINRPVRVVKVRERNFEADRHRVRMLVPENRDSHVVREITRASKVRHANVDRVENSRSKAVVKNSPTSKAKFESTKPSKSKAVVKSTPKKSFTSNNKSNKSKVEVKHSPKSKAFIKSTAPKKSYSSSSKKSFTSASNKSHSSSKKSFASAPKKSSTSSAKFSSKKADVKPSTKFTSNKKMDSSSKHKVSKQQSQKKAVKKPSSKSKHKRNPS
jgi:hypothetical protein